MKEITGNLDLIKMKTLSLQKTVHEKDKAMEWKIVFAKHISDKEFGSNIYKECLKLTLRKQPN